MPAPLITNPNDVNLNDHAQIKNILGRPPGWMLRWGITAITLTFSLLLTLCWVIKYPEIVEGKVVLTTDAPPIHVLARVGGKVSQLLCADQQPVKEGEVLAVLQNTADRKDVAKLETALSGSLENIRETRLGALQLGTLQTAYSTFAQDLKEYRYFVGQDVTERKIANLGSQLEGLQKLNVNLLNQKGLMAHELEMTEKDFKRQTQLHGQGVVSDADLEKSEGAYWSQKRQAETAEGNFINNEQQGRQLEAQIIELRRGRSDGQNTKSLTVEQDVQRLKSAIEEWKQSDRKSTRLNSSHRH